MAEYIAWTATGVVTGLKIWSEPEYHSAEYPVEEGVGAVRIASRMVERQTFLIHQRDGREIEVTLVDSGLVLRNGHVVTSIWVARKGLSHGFCVILDNHTTGAQARLSHNIKQIRPKVGLARTAKFGFLATIPAILTMTLWLLVPGTLSSVGIDTVIMIAAAAIIVLFTIGLIISKVVLDYLQADDHQKIWQVADEASNEVRSSLRQHSPRFRPRVP